ncbi:MAG: hypothetical protein JWO12_1239 [Frankiales bacterium]|nr:hypothetical protein [Frankiales bacterium]
MPEPAPLITITDPLHPAAVRDVVAGAPAPRWTWPVRALAIAVVLLLVVGGAAAKDLRARRQLQQRANRISVVARVDLSSPARLSAVDRITISLALKASDTADLRHISAPSGWLPVGGQDLPLTRDSEVPLELEHVIDCRTPVVAPTSVRGALRVAGVRQREVVVDLSSIPATTQVQDFACGDLDGIDALRMVGSQVLRSDGRSTVTAQLSNISTRDLTVGRVSFSGFSFRPSRPLPLRLPGRAPGLLVEEEVPTRALVLDAVVSSCAPARAALDRAAQSGFPDVLTFFGTSRGRPFAVDRRVAGVEAYLEAEWRSTCGG